MSGRQLYTVTFLPDGQKVSVRPGTTLLDAARKAQAPVRTRCGGVAGCLMCKVSISPGNENSVTEPTAAEIRKLGPMLNQGQRLSCQARVRGDVVAIVPEDPLKAAIRKKLAEQNDDELW